MFQLPPPTRRYKKSRKRNPTALDTLNVNSQRGASLARLFTPRGHDLAAHARRWYCNECEREFDPAEGGHRQCATRPLPAPRPPMKSVSAATYHINDARKYTTGYPSLDRVFGIKKGAGHVEICGLQRGQVIIVGGRKGTGKTTCLSQVLVQLSRIHGWRVLYNSGEEGKGQVIERMRRVGLRPDDLLVKVSETSDIVELADEIIAWQPDIVVQDSLQKLVVDPGRAAGQASQVNKAIDLLCGHAKATGTIVILVNQLNHDGSLAGSERALHQSDTIIMGEKDAQQLVSFHNREKNRMGPDTEAATFEMTSKGLVEVLDPGADMTRALLGEPGVVVFPCAINSRPVVMPIECVVGEEQEEGRGERQRFGLSLARFKHVMTLVREHGLNLKGRDVRIKVPQLGGINLSDDETCDPSIDLALFVAIVSAAAGIVAPPIGFFGELTLTGKVLPAVRADARLDACRRADVRLIACSGMCQVTGEEVPAINHAREVLAFLLKYGQRIARIAPETNLTPIPSAQPSA